MLTTITIFFLVSESLFEFDLSLCNFTRSLTLNNDSNRLNNYSIFGKTVHENEGLYVTFNFPIKHFES
jgi:hypothetical protein